MNPEDTLYCRVPCPLDIAGAGTDLPSYASEYGGRVVTAAVRLYSYAILRPLTEDRILLRDLNAGAEMERGLTREPPKDGPLRAIQAVANRMESQRGYELTVYTEAPPFSGLSSDSASTLAALTILADFEGRLTEKPDLAKLCYTIEKEDLEKKGCLYGAYAGVWGSLLDLTFEHGGVEEYEFLVKDSVRLTFESNSFLAYVGKGTPSAEFYQRLDENYTQGTKGVTEALHRIKANAQALRTALAVGDFKHFATFLNSDWEDRKALHPSLNTSQLSHLIEVGIAAGAKGAKALGAGGGGSLLFFCEEPEARLKAFLALQNEGCTLLPFHADDAGVRLWSQPQANS